MGKNGKNRPVFPDIVKFVNENVGKTVTSKEILLGKEPSRNSETAYLYKLVKLGYVKPINDGRVMSSSATYKIVKGFPPHYNSVMLMDELRIANGLIPEYHRKKS